MKILRSVCGICLLTIALFSMGTNFSSCKKEITRDTVYIKDTVRVPDTSNCNCYDLTDGLVAYYNFTNGNLNDSSGKGNHIVFNNAEKTADRFGNANNAYVFNGFSSFMRVPNSTSLNPANGITIMAIVKMNGFNTGFCHGNQIVGKGAGDQTNGMYKLRVADLVSDCHANVDTTKETPMAFYGDYESTSSLQDATRFMKTNTWATMVYTYDGAESRIYIDGLLEATSSTHALFTPNTSDLLIGRADSDDYPFWWNGAIDEVRIYNKALNQEAVKQLTFHKN